MSVVVAIMTRAMGVTSSLKVVQDDVRRPREEQAEREHRKARIPP